VAKITDKADLNVGAELTVDESTKEITLNVAGNLVDKDGVTWQALYSKLVDLWATGSYQDSPFPMYAIDALSGQYQLGTDGATFSGWIFSDEISRTYMRDGGWSEFNASGVLGRQFVGVSSLGAVSSGTQLYYQITDGGTAVDFNYTDAVNEGIQVYGDATADPTTTTFDNRTYLKGYVREYGKKYDDSVLADTGKTGTGAFLVNLLLSNEDDLKITDVDGQMSSAPYDNIVVDYFTAVQARDIGGVDYDFKVVIDGNGATLEQVYTKVQYLLRQNADINDAGTDGTKTGKIQESLLSFVGDTLVTSNSVFVDNILPADSNRIEFYDDTGNLRTNPFTAAGAMSFNSSLIGAGSSYRLMYTNGPGAGDDYGESGAITVLDNSGSPVTGLISAASIAFDFDYDNDSNGGTAGTNKPVTLIGVRPGFGKYAVATGILTQSKVISLSLVAEQDRVYA
jgi:hypothetical protein